MKLPKNPEAWATILLGFAAIAVIILQVTRASAEPAPVEVALFGILQFIFSIGFAWTFAKLSSYRDFAESQKKFAIAAYRRIKEIERAVDRLIVRTTAPRKESGASGEAEIIREITIGIRDSIASSIADWGDVIGNEIEVVERIEAIRTAQFAEYGRRPNEERDVRISAVTVARRSELDTLLDKLPAPLRLMAEEDPALLAKWEFADQLRSEIEDEGSVEVDCYHDEDCDCDYRSLRIGDRLTIELGEAENRIIGLFALTPDGAKVGSVLSRWEALDYHQFALEFLQILGGMKLPAVVSSVGAGIDGDTEHLRHFRVAVKPVRLWWLEENSQILPGPEVGEAP